MTRDSFSNDTILSRLGTLSCEISAISARGSAVDNEDAWGHYSTPEELVLWVIDGASGIGQDRLGLDVTDAAWYAARLSAQFAAVKPAGDDTAAYFSRIIDAMREEYLATVPLRHRIPKAALPSAAVFWLRIRVEPACLHAQAFWLGDCSLLVHEPRGEPRVIGDPAEFSLSPRDSKLSQDPAARTDGRLLARLRRQRSRMNTQHGYWIFSIDPRAARHVRSTDVRLPHETSLLLMTDGFSRIMDLFHDMDAASLLAARGTELPAVLTRLRSLEHADNSLSSFPRVKVSDDATAVRICFESAAAGQSGP